MRFFNLAAPCSVTYTTVAALSASSMTGVASGTALYTAYPRAACWTLDSAATDVPNGLSIVTCATGGVFRRDVVRGCPGANTVATWYISTAGDNNADGLTSLTPVRDIEEVLYRIGKQPIDGAVVGTVYVYLIAGNFNDGRLYTFDPVYVNDGALAIVGTKTVVATGTLATVTPWVEASSVVGSYGLTGAPNLTSLGYVGLMIRVASGPRAGWKATIAHDLGSGVFQANWCDQSDGSVVEPIVGDSIEVYSTTKIGGDVRIVGSGSTSSATGGGTTTFEDVTLGVAGQQHTVTVSGTAQATFYACTLRGFDVYEGCSYVNLTACYTLDMRSYGYTDLFGCTHTSAGGTAVSARARGIMHVSTRCLINAGSLEAGHHIEGPGTIIAEAPLAVINYGSLDAVRAYPGSQIVLNAILFVRVSTGQGVGYRVFSGGSIYYTVGLPPVSLPSSGAGSPLHDLVIGGTTVALSALPSFNSANGACVVVYQ